MDISVSQLNHRLALQLPAELPLGLVFVAGVVRHFESADEVGNGRTPLSTFELEQNGHRLRCKLVQREAERVQLHENMEVRLGGHLTFDPRYAAYYLLARDVEVIGTRVNKEVDPLAVDLSELVEDEAAFSAALTGIKRRAGLSRQSPTTMPIWVQKLAPPELQVDHKADELEEGELPILVPVALAAPVLDEELVTYLSGLMDSEEEVELTPDVLAQWAREPEAEIPAIETAVPVETAVVDEAQPLTVIQPYAQVADPEPTMVPPRPSVRPLSTPHRTDWLVVVLIVMMVVFTCAILVTAVLLAVR